MQAGFILAIVFAILVTIFALQNAQAIAVNFLFFSGEASLALVILISVGVGAIILGMFNLYSKYKNRKTIKELRVQMKEMQKQLDEYEDLLDRLQPKPSETDTTEIRDSADESVIDVDTASSASETNKETTEQ
ncbi:MAG TPA: hypothetical protein DHN33_01695 [Eubacteriaceae bacterium]|nr:hypothetical protein [Eubacteriaceae bacterium]